MHLLIISVNRKWPAFQLVLQISTGKTCEMGTRKNLYSGQRTVNRKNVCSQFNLTAQIERVQDTINFFTMTRMRNGIMQPIQFVCTFDVYGTFQEVWLKLCVRYMHLIVQYDKDKIWNRQMEISENGHIEYGYWWRLWCFTGMKLCGKFLITCRKNISIQPPLQSLICLGEGVT